MSPGEEIPEGQEFGKVALPLGIMDVAEHVLQRFFPSTFSLKWEAIDEDDVLILTAMIRDWPGEAHRDPQMPMEAHKIAQLPTPKGPRTRRHILVADELWEKARTRAKREGVSVGEIVHRALRVYLA